MAYRPPHHIFPWMFWSAFIVAGLAGILAIAVLFIA